MNTEIKYTNEHPMNPKTLAVIEAGLRKGLKMHAFRSGGGLRVVRLDDPLKRAYEKHPNFVQEGYGEHYAVEVALDHAAESHLEGYGYEDQYGENGLYDNYMTGSSSPNSQLDFWLLRGRTFDAYVDYDLKDIVFELHGYEDTAHPEGMDDRVRKGETVVWENRGYTYRSYPASGGIGTEVINGPEKGGADPWMYTITKTGRAATLAEAISKAFEAPSVETAEK